MITDFNKLPDWVNYVVRASFGDIAYLETLEQGVSGKVHVEGNMLTSFDDPLSTHSLHQWWSLPKENILAERPKEKPRTLTEEEVEILQDLGLLDYALTEAGYDMDGVDGDTSLSVYIFGEDSQVIYSHDEEVDSKIGHVDDFARLVGDMYNYLGFKCRMEIKFDCGAHGSNHVFGDSD